MGAWLAKSAEEAAKNANAHAKEADEAAKRTEEYARELDRKARENAARTKTPPSSGATPSDAEQEALRQGGITPEQLAEYRTPAEQGLIEYLLESGGELLVELFLQDILDCIDDPDIPTCLWAIISSIPVGKLAKVASKLPQITKAIAGIGTLLDKSAAAKKRLRQAEEIIEKVRKKVPDCLGKKKKKPGPKGFAPRSAAAKADDGDECLTAETVVYRSPATGKRASEERGWRIPTSRAAEFNSYIDHSRTEWWDSAAGESYRPGRWPRPDREGSGGMLRRSPFGPPRPAGDSGGTIEL
ncbi:MULTISPECIES: hypothetical protein [unclassified Streptomyces]|uniref:hypothetical protein n=1 Tax=unclassified Streptomyces TaxID=2593676 RepID=UPI0024A9B541|nr:MULTISPECIES: hypothetical protein [unclassified Streptomyces]